MGKVSDSDFRMMIATQVAYLNCVEGKSLKYNIDKIISDYKNNPNPTSKDEGQYTTALKIQKRIEESGTQDCYNWIIRDTCDRNNENGFYGCFIDTRDGDAIVGFRGTEGLTDLDNLYHDGLNADIGLLGNTLTSQQQSAQEFTELMYRKYGDRYDSYNFSGHSLGGNLAEHSTFTAPEGMNIGRCTNWDGPGFSDEYIALHAGDIAKRAGNIDHYHWGFVSGLLFPVPGTNYVAIKAHNGDGWDGVLRRHDTVNLEFDKNGQIIRETLSNMSFGDLAAELFSNGLGSFSRMVEALSPFFIQSFVLFQKPFGLIKVFADYFAYGWSAIKDIAGNIGNSIVSWFKKTFSSSVEGKYSIYASQISSSADELERISERICQIGIEAESVSRKIKYNSISGAYLKSKIGNIGNSLNSYGNKGVRISSATQSAVARINKVDSSVGNKFYALGVKK